MASKTTPARKTLSCIAFREAVSRTSPTPQNLYMFIGRNSNWSAEPTPDAIDGTISEVKTLRANMLAIKKIPASNIALIVPRINWTSGVVYDKYSESDSTLFDKQFYVITGDYNVYKCIDNNSGTASTISPYGTSSSIIQTGDGYQWKFMYNLSAFMVDNFLSTNWMPVPYDEQKTSLHVTIENAAIADANTPSGGHGKNAAYELGVQNILLSQKFDDTESGVIPTDISFRQVGLIANPKLVSGALATAPVYITNTTDSLIDELSGEVVFYINREVVSRADDQSETIELLIPFSTT